MRSVGWSTRQLAELTGTTVNTIRHYHAVGLLEQPARRLNGYKQYGVRELVSLLRVLRLVRLGVPLSQVCDVAGTGSDASEIMRQVDADLGAHVERIQRARSEVAAILRDDAPPDAPPGFADVAAHLSESDTAMLHIASQLYDERAMSGLRKMVELDSDTGSVAREIDRLPASADEDTRERLADDLAPVIARNLLDHPWIDDPVDHLLRDETVARGVFVEAVSELYNSAQLDVIARAGVIARTRIRAVAGEDATE